LINPQQARESTDLFDDPYRKAWTLYEISKAQAAEKPEEALMTANLIQDNFLKAEALYTLAKAQISRNPGQVNGLLQEASAAANAIQDEPGMDYPAQHWKTVALGNISVIRALAYPDQPLDDTHLMHDDSAVDDQLNFEKAQSLSELAEAQAFKSPEQVRAFVHRMSYFKDLHTKALIKIAKVQAARDVEQALTTVHLIQNDLGRAKAFWKVAKVQVRANKANAYEMFFRALDMATNVQTDGTGGYELCSNIIRAIVKIRERT
jgi:hypothetical protein